MQYSCLILEKVAQRFQPPPWPYHQKHKFQQCAGGNGAEICPHAAHSMSLKLNDCRKTNVVFCKIRNKALMSFGALQAHRVTADSICQSAQQHMTTLVIHQSNLWVQDWPIRSAAFASTYGHSQQTETEDQALISSHHVFSSWHQHIFHIPVQLNTPLPVWLHICALQTTAH